MINIQERTGSFENVIDSVINKIKVDIRVAIPCYITSFNAELQTCEAQPTIKGQITHPNGKIESINFPLLVDVPVIFPASGGVTMTFPIKEGDECLIVFSDKCIDFWWQNSGIQESGDPRKHHLADGIAILGVRSVPKVINNISTESMQIRADNGNSFIELNPNSQNISIKTTSTINIDAEKINATANAIDVTANAINLTAPITTINGILKINGSIIQGADGESHEAIFNGSIKATGDIKATVWESRHMLIIL